jgi:hypothetical protein
MTTRLQNHLHLSFSHFILSMGDRTSMMDGIYMRVTCHNMIFNKRSRLRNVISRDENGMLRPCKSHYRHYRAIPTNKQKDSRESHKQKNMGAPGIHYNDSPNINCGQSCRCGVSRISPYSVATIEVKCESQRSFSLELVSRR